MVKHFRSLKEERDKATEIAYARMPSRLSQDEKNKWLTKKQNARKILKRNIHTECQKAFPDLVRSACVWKWDKQCAAEGWEQIPEANRVRWIEVPNSWRTKMKLPPKGRPAGGLAPIAIQRELDKLVAEHVLGASDITERKEVVSWADIDSQMN